MANLSNYESLRQNVAAGLGINNTAGVYDFDTSTQPTLNQVQQDMNDAIREIISYDYTFLEDFAAYQFYHTVSGVQSVYLSGTSISGNVAISGIVTPYPSDVLLYTHYSQNTVQNVATNFSGITFTGTSAIGVPYSGVSNSGNVTFATWTGSGFQYDLDDCIGKVQGVWIQHGGQPAGPMGFGVQCSYINWHDLNTLIPVNPSITVNTPQNTPYLYSEYPGLGVNNNRSLYFFPVPQSSGSTFQVHYFREHVDMVNDTDTQTVIPPKFQQVIVYATLEKITAKMQDERFPIWKAKKDELIQDMQIWDANNPNKMNTWRDFGYRNGGNNGDWNNPYNTSSNQPL